MARIKGQKATPAASGAAARACRRPPRVAILIENLFLFVPVETAVRGAGALPVAVREPEAAEREGCRVLVVDLDALAKGATARLAPLCRGGVVVLAFGPHVEGETLAAVRAAGAVALPRSAFFPRLPELLQVALATAGRSRRAGDGAAESS